jgi:hypothetical protein
MSNSFWRIAQVVVGIVVFSASSAAQMAPVTSPVREGLGRAEDQAPEVVRIESEAELSDFLRSLYRPQYFELVNGSYVRTYETPATFAQRLAAGFSVDYSTETLYFVLGGQRPTGGHRMALNHVDDSKSELVFHATLQKPGQGCIASSSLTYPAIAVKLPKNAKAARLELSEVDRECE